MWGHQGRDPTFFPLRVTYCKRPAVPTGPCGLNCNFTEMGRRLLPILRSLSAENFCFFGSRKSGTFYPGVTRGQPVLSSPHEHSISLQPSTVTLPVEGPRPCSLGPSPQLACFQVPRLACLAVLPLSCTHPLNDFPCLCLLTRFKYLPLSLIGNDPELAIDA